MFGIDRQKQKNYELVLEREDKNPIKNKVFVKTYREVHWFKVT